MNKSKNKNNRRRYPPENGIGTKSTAFPHLLVNAKNSENASPVKTLLARKKRLKTAQHQLSSRQETPGAINDSTATAVATNDLLIVPTSDHRMDIKHIQQAVPPVSVTVSHHAAGATLRGSSVVRSTDMSTKSAIKIPTVIDPFPRNTMKKSDMKNRCNRQQENFGSNYRTAAPSSKPQIAKIKQQEPTSYEKAASDIDEQYTETNQHFATEETEIKRQQNLDTAISPKIAADNVRTQHSQTVAKPKKPEDNSQAVETEEISD